MRQGPYRELDFYQCVSNVIAATTTLQNFSFTSFWSLPTKISTTCLALTQVIVLSFEFIFHFTTCVCLLALFSDHKLTASLGCKPFLALPQWCMQSFRETILTPRKCAVQPNSELRLQNCADQTRNFSLVGKLCREVQASKWAFNSRIAQSQQKTCL